jgi:hypothetical protein
MTRDRDLASAAEQEWAADTLEQHWIADESTEDLNNGGTHLLDLVAATDHLACGIRHDFTVWDALEEALRWWHADQAALHTGAPDGDLDSPRDGSDPLGDHLGRIVEYIDDHATLTAAEIVQQAVRRWAIETANRYNEGHHWPHPTARRSFPPPLTDA